MNLLHTIQGVMAAKLINKTSNLATLHLFL